MANVKHGSRSGVNFHDSNGERCCLSCADFAADRSRAARISYRRCRYIRVSVESLGLILRVPAAVDILAAEIGPQTLNALRRYRAGEQRG